MSITIENAEVEALLADLTEKTRRTSPDLLLDVLRRERERLAVDRDREAAVAIASGRLLHARWKAAEDIDPRPIDAILA
jgi:hypothetical protein